MSKRPGFTVIELIIALTVTIMALAVGIPRFNTFLRRQEFSKGVQKITRCMQRAQQIAASPRSEDSGGGGVRYSKAMINYDNDQRTASCTIMLYGNSVPLSTLLTGGGSPLTSVSFPVETVTDITVVDVTFNNDPLLLQEIPSGVGVIFGAVERGIPVGAYALCTNPFPCMPFSYSPAAVGSSADEGFRTVFTLNDYADISTDIIVTVEKLGVPISHAVN